MSKFKVRNMEYHKCGANNGIFVETITYVGTTFFEIWKWYEVERCDVERLVWVI